MKKKLIILLGILGVLGIFGYTSIAGAKTDTEVTADWELPGKKLDNIQLIGAEQDVEIKLERTQNKKNTVRLEGKVSSSTARSIKKAKATSKGLIMELSSLNKIRVMATNEGKRKLKVTISLGKNTELADLRVKSVIGNVDMLLPKDYKAKYSADNKDMGEIKIPNSSKGTTHSVEVVTTGNITVQQ